MNIPHKYLINNGLSEQKKKFYEKLTSSYKRAYIEYKKNNNTDYFHKKVINWLFSQNEETRMILCCVENKKYTNTFHEAYSYYVQNSKNLKFRITDEDKFDGEKFNLEITNSDYNNYFDNNEYSNYSNIKKNDFEKIQSTFLNNIVFYQCESPISDINNYSNYFTLNPDFLRNEEIFKNDCNELSCNNFLSSPIMTKKEIQNKINILSFELPYWISNDNNENCGCNCSCHNEENYNEENNNKKKFFTLSQYFLSLIEQVLSIRYLLFYENKNLKEIISSTYLYDLFNKRKLILAYLNNIGIESKLFYNQFKIADINSKIFYDQNIEEFIQEKKNYINEFDYENDFESPYLHQMLNDNINTLTYESEKVFDELLVKHKKDKNEFNKSVINMCMFFNISKLFTLDDFFLRLIFEKIYEEYSKKVCDELIFDDEKKKKRKRKKKKNNKEENNNNNNNNNINNINNNVKNNINNNIKNNDINIKDGINIKDDLNKNIKNEIINNINKNNNNEELFNFIKNLIMDNLFKEINKINEKMKINNINEKKSKNNKKEKDFFLYKPVIKKKEKKNNNNTGTNKSKNINLNNNINSNNNTINNQIKINNNNNIEDELKNNNNNDNKDNNENKNIIINNNNNGKEYREDIKKNEKNKKNNNISIQSHINSFTLSSSNSSSTSSDSINPNKINNNIIINIANNEQIDNNNLFVIHQNPMMISYEKINKLTEDIFIFNKDMENLLFIIRKIKIEIKHHFESIIKKIYHKNSKIEIYGSSSYHLDIESSDLDLSISTKSKLPLNSLVEFLLNNNYNNQYLNINPIYTASIPVIKLDIDYLKLNDDKIKDLYNLLINNEYYKICIKNNFYNNFNIIKIDISMNSINYKQMHFIKKGSNHFPQIRPLIKIMKKLLIFKNMNNSYKGGMSSYCLFLIIYSYLKMHKSFYSNNNNDYNIGSLLIGFLFHYIMCIDFKYTIINPCLSNPFRISGFPIEIVPTIIEPTTMKNVGKNIYKIFDVVNVLKEIYRDIFIVIKDEENNDNFIYKLFRKYIEKEK